MTERLYLSDSHLTHCDATVLRCDKTETGYDLVLDRTIIFDNAGGQPCDTGMLGDIRILGCDEVGGELLHHADKPANVGETLPLTLDWARRFDFMQQHTGEHLLSYAAQQLFGVNNVGFHLAMEETTIDLDGPLSSEALHEIETLANRYITDNRKVTATYFESVEALEAANLPLRKQAEGLHAPIRIVRVEGADCCTCCAPHCKFSGEVGPILITSAIAYKGGMRLTFLCGGRALRHAQKLHADMDMIARGFSTARENVPTAVEQLREEASRLRRREKELMGELNTYIARDLIAAAEPAGKNTLIFSVLEGADPDRLKSLALQTAQQSRTLTILLGTANDRLSYVLACSKDLGLDMGELCQAVNAATGGRGGGRNTLAQGSAANTAGLRETAEQLKGYFLSRLKSHK